MAVFNNWFRKVTVGPCELIPKHHFESWVCSSISASLLMRNLQFLIGPVGYFRSEDTTPHLLFLTKTLFLIQSLWPPWISVTGNSLSSWGEQGWSGRISYCTFFQKGMITSGIWELRWRKGVKKEAWTTITTAKCLDFFEMICVGPGQWHLSQSDVALTAQINWCSNSNDSFCRNIKFTANLPV